jgi:5-(carboxyamino)imidazole ribonucleotide synthase
MVVKNMITKIGIIGGGQLGKMMILDAKRLGFYFVILDPTKNCPADSISDEHIVADFDDIKAIEKLANRVDVVTYEFEHISLKALERLEESGHLVYPSSQTLSKIQNKFTQKEWLRKNNIPVPNYQIVESLEQLNDAHKLFGYPMILKTCTGGYDGKGNALIKNPGDEDGAYKALGGGALPLMVEEFISLDKEVSVLACRSTNGDETIFPIAENYHVDNILDETVVPARITKEQEKRAMEIARAAIKAFGSYGMLCVEMFITTAGQVLVNELAPRPHNSGHYTIEGCYTSQYEQHIRAIVGLPLGSTELIRPSVMKNLIGDHSGVARLQGLEKAYKIDNVKVHIYGKETVSKGRKMGHITVTDATIEEALKKARQAHKVIKFKL